MHKIKFFVIFIFLFFVNCTTEPVETDLLVPVDFSNIPNNMILTDFHTDKIEVKIRTAPKLMELINKENIRYPVDLYTDLEFDPAGASDSIEPGAYLIPVELKQIPMNPLIRIVSVKPSYLSVQLEKKIEKVFQVTISCQGLPAKGYIALEPVISPVSVKLTGAASFINSIKELKTKTIDLSNAKKTFQKKIPLDLDNPLLISSFDHIISVKIPIVQELVAKTVENIPIQIFNYNAPSKSVIIEPSDITIKVKGPFETLSNKKIMDQIYSFVDIKDLKHGVYDRHAYINIPVGLIMTDAIPQVFTIKIE